MKKSLFFFVSILALQTAGVVNGEDKIERIDSLKGSRELVYRDEVLAEVRSYDAQGAIREEKFFDASSLPFETRSYIREGGLLVRVELTDASGIPEGSMTYRYDRYGRLLGVDFDGSLGTGSVGMIASGAIPQGSWVSAGAMTVLGYDQSGRIAIVQTIKDGVALSVESREYSEGGLISLVRTENNTSGLSSELIYDTEGRASMRTDTPTKGPQIKTEYRYDDSGRLVEEIIKRGGHRSSRTLAYAEGGAPVREETRVDGELLLTVEYIENGRVEEIYNDGIVFVRATYIGGRKIKDEFYADGLPLRTREYR
jgi:YD repeat-containing protein